VFCNSNRQFENSVTSRLRVRLPVSCGSAPLSHIRLPEALRVNAPSMMLKSQAEVLFASALAFFIGLTSYGCGVHRGPSSAVLRDDWASVLRPSAPASASTPVLLKGHALLALNRDDEAVCVFQTASEQNKAAWDAWTKELVRANPRVATIHYLRGDAFARMQDLKAAEGEFSRALQIGR
jgi:tetratricopeptide (TPR) repeat protein